MTRRTSSCRQGDPRAAARAVPWRKSSYSDNSGGNCVEARVSVLPQVRDGKLGDDSPLLTLDEATFSGLLHQIKTNAFTI